jgi:hypothetical protein
MGHEEGPSVSINIGTEHSLPSASQCLCHGQPHLAETDDADIEILNQLTLRKATSDGTPHLLD